MSNRILIWGFILVLLTILLVGCSDDPVDMQAPVLDKSTCEGCHTDGAMLQATVVPDPELPEDEGEG